MLTVSLGYYMIDFLLNEPFEFPRLCLFKIPSIKISVLSAS